MTHRGELELLRTIADHLEEVIWVTSPSGAEILYASPGFQRIFGVDPAELQQNPQLWTELIREDFRDEIHHSFSAACEGWRCGVESTEWNVEFPIVRPDGEVRWIHDRADPVVDEVTGKLLLVVGSAIDVTKSHARSIMLKTVVQSVLAGLAIVDSDGIILMVNPQLEEMFRYPPGNLVGQSIDTLVPTALRTSHRLHRESFAQNPSRRPMGVGRELLALRKDGTEFPVEVGLAPITDQSNVLVSVADVTDRQESRRALFEAQQINRTGTWTFDLVKDEVVWSPELFRILRLPMSDVAPAYETHRTLFTPGSWAKLEPAVQQAAENGIPYELELELAIRDEDGEPRFAVARCQPEIDSAGRVVRLAGTFQDVTDLVRTRHQVDHLLERLSLAQSAAGFGVWEWNPARDTVVWDAQLREIWGVPEGEAITGETWKRRVHPADLQKATENFRTLLAHPTKSWQSAYRIAHPNLGTRHLRAAATVIRDPEGEPFRVVGVNWDVTDQVRLQEEARRSQNLESLGVLAGGIAHDFNNLLTGILSRAELLELRLGERSTERAMVQGIIDAVESSTRLTTQLLTFSKGGEPMRTAASLEKLVRDTVEFALRGSKTKVHFDFSDQLWGVEMDSGQIGQVVQNLALNADQAMETGGNLTFIARNLPEDSPPPPPLPSGEFVELVIQDTGPGIPAEIANRVFDPYFTTKPNGHGLGLSICYSIIERHQGLLELDDTYRNGTRFRILLPASRRTTEPPVEVATPGVRLTGRVLVVDDFDDVRRTLRMQLESMGLEVDEADTVSHAIAAWEKAKSRALPYDLVLTDLTIPGSGGGLEVLELLRSRDSEIPVIVVSGYGSDPVLANHLEYGFAGFLRKPVRTAQLGLVVSSVLTEAREIQGASQGPPELP